MFLGIQKLHIPATRAPEPSTAPVGPRSIAALAIGLLTLVPVTSGHASALLPMSNGAPDMSLSGSTIAEPLTPSGALFANPAGLCAFEQTTLSGSLGLGFGVTKITNDDGYSQDNDLWASRTTRHEA